MHTPTLIGGGNTIPQTFAAQDLTPFAGDNIIPLGRYALRAYSPRENVDVLLPKFAHSFALPLPVALVATKLNAKELLSVSKIHGIVQKRGANKATMIASFAEHACPSCEQYLAVLQPCSGSKKDERSAVSSYRKEYMEMLASTMKAIPVDALRAALDLTPEEHELLRHGAIFLGLEETTSSLPTSRGHERLVFPIVPWGLLAIRGNKRLAMYLAQLHRIPVTHRLSKDDIVSEIGSHTCLGCRQFRAVFSPAQAKNTTSAPVDLCQAAAEGMDYINADLKQHVYPPPPLSIVDELSIVRDFCSAVTPEAFEEAGCAVCGQLTLLTELSPLDSIDCSLDPLVEPDLARKQRTTNQQAITYQSGPIVDATCDSICLACTSDLRKGKRPLKSLANGLWVGPVPEVLSRLTYVEQCLIARVRANRYVMRVASGHTKMIGNVIAFAMPTVKVYQHLPPRREDLNEVLAFIFTGLKSPTDEDLSRTPLLVRRNAVADALQWLILNHSDYADVVIDQEALRTYPAHGVPVEVVFRTSEGHSNTVVSATSVHDTEEEVGVDEGQCPFTVHGLVGSNLETMTVAARKAAALQHIRSGGSVLAIGHSPTPESLYDNYHLYPQMYPWLFPYGSGGIGNDRLKGLMSETNQKKWLLMYHDKRFQLDARFVVMSFNHEQMKTGSRSSFALIRRSNFSTVAQNLSKVRPDVLSNLASRLQAGERVVPENEQEKLCFSLMDQIDNVNTSVQGSLSGKKRMRHELWSLITYIGAPSWFVTLSPVDTKHPICIYWADKQKTFSPDLRHYNDRARLVASNPVAGARFFHFLVELFIKCLLRWGDASNPAGIFGNTAAYFGTVEQQGRMTLHLHMLIWVSGAWSPRNLKEKLMDDDGDFKRGIIDYLESCHMGEFLTGKMSDIKERFEHPPEGQPPADPTQRLPVPPPTSSCVDPMACPCSHCLPIRAWHCTYKDTIDNIVYRSNVHSCYARRDAVQHVGQKQHVTGKGCINKDGICTARFPRKTHESSSIDGDGRIVLKKQEPMINNINRLMVYLFGCNTDTSCLSSGTAITATSGYVADYLVKVTLKTYQIFSSIYDVFERNPELATESKDDASAARKLILKMANSLTAKMEVGGPMAAMYLLGNPDRYSSHSFVQFYWRNYVAEVLRSWEDVLEAQENAQGPLQTSYGPTVSGTDQTGAAAEDRVAEDDMEDQRGSEVDKVVLSRKNGVIFAKSTVDDYKMRPPELNGLCLFDWVQCVVRKPSNGAKKVPVGLYQFAEGHPQRDTCFVQFDCKRIHTTVPTFLGPSLPRRDAEDREFYCATMMTFFVPWRTGLDLKTSEEDWVNAFDNHDFSGRYLKIMENMHIRYECYDARDDFHAQLKAQARNKELEDCGSGECSDMEDPDNGLEELDIDDLGDDMMGSWSRGRLAEMRDVENMLRRAGWVIGERRNQGTLNQFCPEKTMSGSRWKALVTKEKNKILNARKNDVASQANVDEDLNLEIFNQNDARIVPGAYLLSNFRVQDVDIVKHMQIIVERFSLNKEQERAFRIIANHSVSKTGEQLKMYIGGMGGTGKSQVIKAIQTWFEERNEAHRMVVLAPTGAAASILKGSTYHTFLGVRTGEHRSGKLPGGPSLDEAKIRMQGVDYIFIDEVSMISCHDFFCIDLQCKYISGLLEMPFGGFNMVLAGDFAQLPPARPHSLYSSGVSRSQIKGQKPKEQEETLGLLMWHQFVTVVILKTNMRQAGESPQDTKLRNALERMRYKDCNDDDIDFLCSLIPSVNQTLNLGDAKWRDVAVITARNAHKDQINSMNAVRFSAENGIELHYFYSIDKQALVDSSNKKINGSATTSKQVRLTPVVQEVLWKQEPHTSKHIAACLPLCVGMPVMIRNNEATELCITKGQEAIVRGWTYYYIPGFADRKVLDTLFVELVAPPKDINLPYLPKNVVPLAKISTSLTATLPNDRTVSINRYQVPILLNFAMTDYCSQGKTRPVNIVDLNDSRSHQAIYTSLSRGKTAADTAILRPFAIDKIQGGVTGYLRQEFRDLDILDEITEKIYSGHIPLAVAQSLRASTISSYRTMQLVTVNLQAVTTSTRSTIRTRTTVPATNTMQHAEPHGPQGTGVEGHTSVKRSWLTVPVVNTSISKRPRLSGGQRPSVQGNLSLQGCTWDSRDWSCAYDSYLTIMKFIWFDYADAWSNDLPQYSSYLAAMHDFFSHNHGASASLNRIRDKLRRKFWTLDPISFPKGNAGTDLYALVQAMHGMTAGETGRQASLLTCINCFSQRDGDPHQAFDKYVAVRHDLQERALNLGSYIESLQAPQSTCGTCGGDMFLAHTFPSLVSIQLPFPTINERTEPVSISNQIQVSDACYRLSSVIYCEGAHFKSRMIDANGRVYSYDGMKGGGRIIYDFFLSGGECNERLSDLDGSPAAMAMYLAL